ncbi:hypothetical protein T492DRAFT_868831, partial [Pavlovales sp. CCMP2436]
LIVHKEAQPADTFRYVYAHMAQIRIVVDVPFLHTLVSGFVWPVIGQTALRQKAAASKNR